MSEIISSDLDESQESIVWRKKKRISARPGAESRLLGGTWGDPCHCDPH